MTLKNENVQYLTNVASTKTKSTSVPVHLEGKTDSDGTNLIGIIENKISYSNVTSFQQHLNI